MGIALCPLPTLDSQTIALETPFKMQLEELRKLTSNGFRPFTLYLSDGRQFDVPHPDFIAISRRTVVVIGEDQLPNLIDPLHIVSTKPNAPAQDSADR